MYHIYDARAPYIVLIIVNISFISSPEDAWEYDTAI